MDRAWKQILASVIIGTLIPRIVLTTAGLIFSGDSETVPVDDQAVSATLPTAQTGSDSDGTEQNITYIPVLTGAGDVTMMRLEEYVVGVVLAEMPASFEMEALKAQAVVARTYAMRRYTSQWRHTAGAVCTDPGCCQDYITEVGYLQSGNGEEDSVDKIRRAVSETVGQVLTYEGNLIDATYFSCSGGRTEDAVAVWGTEVPYLQAVDSPGEEEAEAYYERLYFTAAEFSALLDRELAGTPESWLGEVSYTDGGGVAGIYIGGLYYTGVQLRQQLGLNSTAFAFTPDAGGMTVETLGYGHRVGMSQYGAEAMAVAGSTYGEILSHYYPGTRIDKIVDME